MTAQAQISVSRADMGRLSRAVRPPISGLLDLTADVEGTGLSPVALVGSLKGSAKINIADGQVVGLDPHIFDAVNSAVDHGLNIENGRISDFVNKSLEKGQLSFSACGIRHGSDAPARFVSRMFLSIAKTRDCRSPARSTLPTGRSMCGWHCPGQAKLLAHARPFSSRCKGHSLRQRAASMCPHLPVGLRCAQSKIRQSDCAPSKIRQRNRAGEECRRTSRRPLCRHRLISGRRPRREARGSLLLQSARRTECTTRGLCMSRGSALRDAFLAIVHAVVVENKKANRG